jgi:hypothetical protein
MMVISIMKTKGEVAAPPLVLHAIITMPLKADIQQRRDII